MRDSRKQIAEATLAELQAGHYINRSGKTISFTNEVNTSIDSSLLYRPEDLDALMKSEQQSNHSYAISLVNQSTLSCLFNVYSTGGKIGVLNFASAKNPGGGFLGGSQAQEESLARSGSLYPSLMSRPEFYSTNRKSPDTFYTDCLIYSPQVVFFKKDAGEYLDNFVTADVITIPAVNKGALRSIDKTVEKEIELVMKRRIRYILAVSASHHVNTLILGAWGCGVFRNDPSDAARYFKEVLMESPTYNIASIFFAIIGNDSRAMDAFDEIANTRYRSGDQQM